MKLLPKTSLLILITAFLPILIYYLTSSLVLTISLTIILSLGEIFWLSKTIVTPIKELLFSVQNLTKDKLYQSPFKSSDELGELTEDFNNEVGKIKNLLTNHQVNGETNTGQRNQLALVLSAISDGVVALDLNHNIVIFNAAAQRISGYTSSEVIGKPFDSLFKVFDKTSEIAFANYCPVNSSGYEGVIFNKPALELQGKIRSTVNITTGQIADGSSVNIGCILTLHDITKEEGLERMKMDFVSMAAHELRTPLTSIRGYLDVIYKESPPKGEYFGFMEKAIIGTNQLFALITNLLDVSKIERGAISVNMTALDLTAILKKVTDNLLTSAGTKQLELQYIAPTTEIPKVNGDSLKLEEVVGNLITNAINYTSPNGKITVSLEATSQEVTVHVADTGKGIPKEAIPNLFTKFFRVRGALDPEGSKGTGLGLYISKSIIDLHRGKIWVNSEVGKGSTFSFSIPVHQS